MVRFEYISYKIETKAHLGVKQIQVIAEKQMRSKRRSKVFIGILAIAFATFVLPSCAQKPAPAAGWEDSVRSGRLAMQVADYQNAKQFISKGLAEAARQNVDGVVIAPVYLDLAKSCEHLNDPAAARTAVDAALVAARSGGKSNEQLIPIYKESAKLFYRKKDFVNSQAAAHEALRLERECCDAKSDKLLDSLNLCIAAACAQDRCADTGPLLLEQLEIRRQHLGLNHPHVAVSLCLLGELAEKKGRWKEAEERYKEALAIRKKSEPGLVKRTEENLIRVRSQLERKSG